MTRNNEFLKGSLILFFMINIFNLLNYFFHFFMARMLSVSEYGVLAVLTSFIYFFNILASTIQTLTSRYTAKFNTKKESGKIKKLMFLFLSRGIFIASIIFFLFAFLSIFFSWFLKINFSLFLLTGIFIFCVILTSSTRGILQGLKKFKELGTNMISESVLKILIALILVYFGLGIKGAMIGVVISPFIAFFIAFVYLKKILKKREEKIKIKKFWEYSLNVFIGMIGIVLLYTIDIILARRFFSPEIAGKYAVASMIGKMIFFGTYGISQSMFPIVTEKYEKKENTKEILKKSLLIVFLISSIALIIIYFFPSLLIKVLFGDKYIDVSNILIYTSIAYVFISLTNISVFYSLKKKENKIIYFILFSVIAEIVVISIFKKSLFSYSLSLMIINILIFIFSLFLLKNEK